MRNICPKVNSYYGPVYGREGKQCATSLDLDEAMLATRDFWFQAPTDCDNSWTPVLAVYEQQPLLAYTEASGAKRFFGHAFAHQRLCSWSGWHSVLRMATSALCYCRCLNQLLL